MAETAWFFPTAHTDISAPPQWTNPTNAYAHDEVLVGPGNGDEHIRYGDFSISLPAGAVIEGVLVEITDLHDPTSHPTDCYLEGYLRIDGVDTDWVTGRNPINGKNEENFGSSSTELWGRSWAVGDFTNANFLVGFKLTRDGDVPTVYFDAVRVKVYYRIGNIKKLSGVLFYNNVKKAAGTARANVKKIIGISSK